jgi:hypothetical protein
MKRLIVSLLLAGALTLPAVAVFADASPPTNGGSANGGGSSGQCTGDMASRPPSCHNGLGSGN